MFNIQPMIHMTPQTNRTNDLSSTVMVGINMAFDDHSSVGSATSTLRQPTSPFTFGNRVTPRLVSSTVSHGYAGRGSLFSAWENINATSSTYTNSPRPTLSYATVRANPKGDNIITSHPVSSISSPTESNQLSAIKIDAETLAKQITLIEMEIFACIKPEEFLSFKWTGRDKSKYAPNIVASTRWFNQLNYWVRQEILKESGLKDRAEVMGHLIKTAKKLIKLNNLCSAMSVFTALQSHCVHRLKQTFAALSNKARSQYRRLQELFSQENNHQRLRDLTQSLKLPAIPYLGLFLTDLTYINVAHPKQREIESPHRTDKLNNILRIIADFQQSHYPFEVDDRIRNYLLSCSYLEELQCFLEEELCKVSESLESNAPPPLSKTTGPSEFLSRSMDSTTSGTAVTSFSSHTSPLHNSSMRNEMMALQHPPLNPIRTFSPDTRAPLHALSVSSKDVDLITPSLPYRDEFESTTSHSHHKSQSGPNLLEQEDCESLTAGYPPFYKRMYERNASVSGVGNDGIEDTMAWLNQSPLNTVTPPFYNGKYKCNPAAVKPVSHAPHGSVCSEHSKRGHRKTQSVCNHNLLGNNAGTPGQVCNCVSPAEEVVRLHLLDGSLLDDGDPASIDQRLEEETSIVARAAAHALAGFAASTSTLNGSSGVFVSPSQTSNSQEPTAANSTVALNCPHFNGLNSASLPSSSGAGYNARAKASESGESGLHGSNAAERSSTMSSLSHHLADPQSLSDFSGPSVSPVVAGVNSLSSAASNSCQSIDCMRMVCQGCLQRKTHWKKGRKPLFNISHRFWVVLMESGEDAFLVYFEPTTFRASKREEFSRKECQVQRLRDTWIVQSERELDECISVQNRFDAQGISSPMETIVSPISSSSKTHASSFYLFDPTQRRAYKIRGSGPIFPGPAVNQGGGILGNNSEWFNLIRTSILAARDRHRAAESLRRTEDLIILDVDDNVNN